MDLLNTFLVFNLTATIAVLAGLFFMRDNAAATVANATPKIAHFNVAGAAGAATSIALLTSLAILFR